VIFFQKGGQPWTFLEKKSEKKQVENVIAPPPPLKLNGLFSEKSPKKNN
jgi:hypothetical protein